VLWDGKSKRIKEKQICFVVLNVFIIDTNRAGLYCWRRERQGCRYTGWVSVLVDHRLKDSFGNARRNGRLRHQGSWKRRKSVGLKGNDVELRREMEKLQWDRNYRFVSSALLHTHTHTHTHAHTQKLSVCQYCLITCCYSIQAFCLSAWHEVFTGRGWRKGSACMEGNCKYKLLNMQPTMGGPPLMLLGERIIKPTLRVEEGRISRNITP
jgi:hypothetical protein